jgi:hypothetical protein
VTAPLVDPCSCTARCTHGERCMGGHANSPGRHTYLCEVCSPVTMRTYSLAYPTGQWIGVAVPCGHAIGPDRPSALTTALIEHRRTCKDGAS